tara:strand:+ start:12420 stop:13088 length:669 start_codon:yes stop_codon:yes gene_type:complete
MYNIFKRFFDIIFSLIVLIALIPFFIPIMIILRLTAEGEIFYMQERYGINNTKFKIIKFATMLKNSMEMGTGSITLKNDPRVTNLGSFLRKTKINELPQIFNILKGDISFVGPRPLVKKTFMGYNKEIRCKIYKTKPGLTGIGSIVFRDEESIISNVINEDPHKFYERVIAPHKGELEIWYQKNQGFLIDFQIILMTAWVIIFPKSKLYYSIFKNIPKREQF